MNFNFPAAALPARPRGATPSPAARPFPADRALRLSVMLWCGVALLGQLIFGAYVLLLYGGALLRGQPQGWNSVTRRGYLDNDLVGNLVFGVHLLFTVLVVLGGVLQLWPALRRRWPQVHRWNGRLYLLGAAVLSIGGVVMLLTRGTVGGVWQQLGTAFNGLLILAFAALAWREARARRFATHRRWALRLFLAVGGVWFFRIGLMAWVVAHQGPAGFDPKTFSGPFLTCLAWAQALLPLAVLEVVLRAQANGGAASRWGVAAGLAALTLLTAGGITAATLLMWLPRL